MDEDTLNQFLTIGRILRITYLIGLDDWRYQQIHLCSKLQYKLTKKTVTIQISRYSFLISLSSIKYISNHKDLTRSITFIE